MPESELVEQIKAKASKRNKTILLPESHDDRILKAAEILTKEGIASIITLGAEDKILADAKRLGLNFDGIKIIDPEKSDKFADFCNIYLDIQKKKGKDITLEKVQSLIKRDIFFGAMLVREGIADGSVSGSVATTADVLRASIQCIGMAPGISIISSFFLLVFPEKLYSFGDCAVNPNPTAEQLADIAISTAENHTKLTGDEAFVALLSFSTKGSAEHDLVTKVREATKIAQTKRPDLNIDGELQFDAAIVDEIGKKKAPGSKVAGKANVLIFPDLQAGNIGYKIAQRLGNADAIGPIGQGLKKPFFDLSRGCSVDEIVATAAIAALMA
jgi:phosphate acetyltransferase